MILNKVGFRYKKSAMLALLKIGGLTCLRNLYASIRADGVQGLLA